MVPIVLWSVDSSAGYVNWIVRVVFDGALSKWVLLGCSDGVGE